MRIQPLKRVQLRYAEKLLICNGRKNISQTLGHHGFSASGASLEQKIMHTCRTDQGGTLGDLLPFYIFKIEWIALLIVETLGVDSIKRKSDLFCFADTYCLTLSFKKRDCVIKMGNACERYIGNV